MQSVEYMAMAPLLMLSATVVIVLLQIAVRRSHAASVTLTTAGLAAALASVFPAFGYIPVQVTALLTIDAFGLFFVGLILAATAATALLAYGYLSRLGGQYGEFYLLLLMAALGACVLVLASHFAAFFIGLEILSISLYALIAYPTDRTESLEAGLKYLILAAVSSAFLLFGIALIYMHSGALDFATLKQGLQTADRTAAMLFFTGMAMLMVGFGFKLALVPFHMWTPDVYQGAPAPTTAFVATVSKISMAALLVRLFFPFDAAGHHWAYQIFGLPAAVSMVGGNLLALRQNHVKRILAYSSIAHLGYLLVAFMAGGRAAMGAVAFYLVAYATTILGCFAVVTVLSGRQGDADHLSSYQGLFFRHPWLGGAFSIMLLSLAGIPLTVGFIGKFILVAAGAGSALWWLVVTLVLTSGVGLFYYLRVIVAIFGTISGQPDPDAQQAADRFTPPAASIGIADAVVLAATTLALIWLGVLPGVLLDFIDASLRLMG